MPKFGPVKRKDLIRYLRQLNFTGPFSGGKHQFMVKENLKVRIPNPHKSDVDKNLLNEILKEIGIDKTKWGEL
ncbi:MAG: type II toxin-antitoxin system HicA family toxin [Planctomycetes bacterium]|nr:type II toxin-antitoxin system HicA family toxin [Planctomycetota bacterium]